ncbi:amidase, putative [Talaromyces stipitatus ATCC 10500]|uniref:Amidase, putative n=1 Tax=Talaromyces stipitatus (strain ATCC 10500 / CBS 375.48 / QM 6759 / NRRL 1006) TaxID=441959 RepID=B8MAL4_TALSN|nr:amidase, putative [Talaromyces stipitatus ATCC 10500]EED17438.1 amidase, putative [Talaromyces stipitatus ATCC 10500]
MQPWEEIASRCQSDLLNSIPQRWRLSTRPSSTDVRDVPRSCGLLTQDQLKITEMTAAELVSQLSSGQLSSFEVTEAFCARAAIAHQCVNCLTAYFYEEALQRAQELDRIFKETGKVVGPLHGLPIAVKDYFHMKDKAGTMGLIAWHDKISDSDASIVQLLKTAGAIPFARTTMPQTGMLLETVSNLWGRTLNPFNTNFSAGGSSGGDGSLVGMHGSPFCPSTDIGGSIRAPATFNGLYGIRPTAERIPKSGMITTAPGQISVKVSCGPVCHSVADIKLVTKILLTHYDYIGYEPTAVPMPWNDNVITAKKLSFGLMRTDGCVTPQPPTARALVETAEALKAAGHEVVEFDPPFDFWEASQVVWKLYFQTGAKETKSVIASAGEPLMKSYEWYLDTFKVKGLTVAELFQLNTKQTGYKKLFAQAWQNTQHLTSTGRSIDALICPCAPSAGFPHDFPIWWGYFSIWNLLDYPSTILPLKKFKIDTTKDIKDSNYVPKENVFDRMNWEIYDPQLWSNQPVSIQIVRPPFTDEELIEVTSEVDKVCNAS